MKFSLPKRRSAVFYIGAALILGTIVWVSSFVIRLYMPTITISTKLASAPITDPFQSRFLPSTFYFPKSETHPTDKNGKPMAILAQVNFDEAPHLRGYPKTGILQIFIAAHDDLLGWDMDVWDVPGNSNGGYHVRYFPTVDRDPAKLVADFSFLPDAKDFGSVYLPLHQECTLTFQKRTEFIYPSDARFYKILGKDFFERWGPFNSAVWDWCYDRPYETRHKIGGWADFAQDDPRYHIEDEEWLLLFQMDSESETEIFWGDLGIGNFFIRPEDLKKLDFSKVAYEYSS